MEENTEQRVDLTLFSEKIQELKDQIASVIVGQEQTWPSSVTFGDSFPRWGSLHKKAVP